MTKHFGWIVLLPLIQGIAWSATPSPILDFSMGGLAELAPSDPNGVEDTLAKDLYGALTSLKDPLITVVGNQATLQSGDWSLSCQVLDPQTAQCHFHMPSNMIENRAFQGALFRGLQAFAVKYGMSESQGDLHRVYAIGAGGSPMYGMTPTSIPSDFTQDPEAGITFSTILTPLQYPYSRFVCTGDSMCYYTLFKAIPPQEAQAEYTKIMTAPSAAEIKTMLDTQKATANYIMLYRSVDPTDTFEHIYANEMIPEGNGISTEFSLVMGYRPEDNLVFGWDIGTSGSI